MCLCIIITIILIIHFKVLKCTLPLILCNQLCERCAILPQRGKSTNMSIARNISTSFKVRDILVHSCALALGCCSKCSFSFSRYCCVYCVVSVCISCRIWLLKNSREKSTGDFSSIPTMTPGLAVNLGGCSVIV